MGKPFAQKRCPIKVNSFPSSLPSTLLSFPPLFPFMVELRSTREDCEDLDGDETDLHSYREGGKVKEQDKGQTTSKGMKLGVPSPPDKENNGFAVSKCCLPLEKCET